MRLVNTMVWTQSVVTSATRCIRARKIWMFIDCIVLAGFKIISYTVMIMYVITANKSV